MLYLVDTNILLEILLDQKNAAVCTKLLNTFHEKNVPLIITLFSVHSILINLVNKKKFETAEEFITKIKKSEHILIYRDTIEDHSEIVDICDKTALDFDDAIQYYVAKQAHCAAIISYDSDFDMLEIPRKSPEEILENR